MVTYTASIHDNTEPTFSSKRQWVPRLPPQISHFRRTAKNNLALMLRPLPPNNLHQVSANGLGHCATKWYITTKSVTHGQYYARPIRLPPYSLGASPLWL